MVVQRAAEGGLPLGDALSGAAKRPLVDGHAPRGTFFHLLRLLTAKSRPAPQIGPSGPQTTRRPFVVRQPSRAVRLHRSSRVLPKGRAHSSPAGRQLRLRTQPIRQHDRSATYDSGDTVSDICAAAVVKSRHMQRGPLREDIARRGLRSASMLH